MSRAVAVDYLGAITSELMAGNRVLGSDIVVIVTSLTEVAFEVEGWSSAVLAVRSFQGCNPLRKWSMPVLESHVGCVPNQVEVS